MNHVPSQRAERGLPAEPRDAGEGAHQGLEELLWPRNENFALLQVHSTSSADLVHY